MRDFVKRVSKLLSIKRQIVLIYAVCIFVALSTIGLGHFMATEFKGSHLYFQNDDASVGQRRSMAQLQQIEHITQENYSQSNSTSVSVVYKSDSIFEEAATKNFQEYLTEYMPKGEFDVDQCDILLSQSEYTVDSKGHYCSLDELDPETSCCASTAASADGNGQEALQDNTASPPQAKTQYFYQSQCLSSANFTQNQESGDGRQITAAEPNEDKDEQIQEQTDTSAKSNANNKALTKIMHLPTDSHNLQCCSDINSCVLSCFESNQNFIKEGQQNQMDLERKRRGLFNMCYKKQCRISSKNLSNNRYYRDFFQQFQTAQLAVGADGGNVSVKQYNQRSKVPSNAYGSSIGHQQSEYAYEASKYKYCHLNIGFMSDDQHH